MSQQLSADSLVGQTFVSAGSSDFPVAWPKAADTGLESPVNRQAGKPALQLTARHRLSAISYPLTAIVAILSLIFAIATPTFAVTSGSPYTGIVDRNVFGLKPPTPVAPPTAPEPPPGNITLTGITTILGNKRALLKVSTPPRPPEPAKDENLMLTEGQRESGVEVLEIDERTGSVKVNNSGQVTTLTFEKNGAKALAPASPVPGIPSIARANIAPPNHASTANLGTVAHAPTPVYSPGSTYSSPSGAPGAGSVPQNAVPKPLSEEEEAIIIETRREEASMKGDDTARLFPPTAITPDGAPGMPGGNSPGSPFPQ